MDRLEDLQVHLLSDEAVTVDVADDKDGKYFVRMLRFLNFLFKLVKSSHAMRLYLNDIDKATENIGRIRSAVESVHAHCSLVHSQNIEQQEASRVELEKNIASTNKVAMATKQLIESLQVTCDSFKVSGKYQPQECRLRQNLLNTLTRKYVEVMRSYQSAQLKYSKEMKLVISRRISILNPSLSKDELTEVMATGVGLSEILSQTILQVQYIPVLSSLSITLCIL